MGIFHQLPDLARMRALEARVRQMSDGEVADFLRADDGRWLFVECRLHLANDVAARLVNVICDGLPEGNIFSVLASALEGEA